MQTLLESAIARPHQSFGGIEFYPTDLEKAAAIIESIVKNHPFVDGNKKNEFPAGYFLLYRSNIRLTADQEKAYQFVIDIASSIFLSKTSLHGFNSTHNRYNL